MPTSSPTPDPTATITFTPAPSLTPTPEFVGGVLDENGWVRYTSQMAGYSISLPPDWVCLNRDPQIFDDSVAAARKAFGLSSEDFEDKVELFNLWEPVRMYCVIPDAAAIDESRQDEVQIDETSQTGYTDVVRLMTDDLNEDGCEAITAETIDGRGAAMTTCSRDFDHVFSILTVYYRYDYVLDGDRYIDLHFRSANDALYPLFEQIAATLKFE